MDLISVATSYLHNDQAARMWHENAANCRRYNDETAAAEAELMRDAHDVCAEAWRRTGVDRFGDAAFEAACRRVAGDGVEETARRELAKATA